MPGSMSKSDLVVDLKNSLNDSGKVFTADADADFIRHLSLAAADFNRVLPLVKMGELTLVADQALYAAPADLHTYNGDAWSAGKMPKPWEEHYPGLVPTVRTIGPAGTRQLAFSPAPGARHLAVLGSTFKYYYSAAHVIGDETELTTISADHRALLILRSQAEAMRELAFRNITKPTTLGPGGAGMTGRNGTPASLHAELLAEFDRRACGA